MESPWQMPLPGETAAALAVFVFLMFSSSISAVASPIPPGSKLTAEGGVYWLSPSGDFAFGFFNRSDQPNQYSVGVRFNAASIPPGERAVVWVAGGGVSVGRHSYLHLTEAGELLLFDALSGVTAWASNTSRGAVSSAHLLDDGNLVLLNNDQGVVWQSFDTPSDTLLPGQKLTPTQTLRAAGRDSVSSYYTLSMDTGGQLRLRWETNVSYWNTKAFPSAQPAFAAVFTSDGALKLLDGGLRAMWSSFGDDHDDPHVGFRFLRLDTDGNLRMYSWAEESKSWRSVWQAVQDQCHVFATCGLNGVCFFNSSGRPACKCPFGSATGQLPRCLAPYEQSCRSGATMRVLKHTFLYGVYPPEDVSLQMGSEECRKSCLQDPSCTSATATNDGDARCLVKRTRFVTGYEDPALASVSFVKVCLDPFAAALPTSFSTPGPPSPSSPARKSSRPLRTRCLVGAAAATFIALFLIQLAVGVFVVRRRKKNGTSKASSQLCANPVGVVSLSPSEIKNLTSNFEHRLGSNTYKGVLSNNKVVVIRDMKGSADAVEDRHFRRWVALIGGVHHKNLVRLEAYNCMSEQRFLVYEFAKNGSVDRWLGEPRLSRRLTWGKRMEICTGVARALAYLHSECREFVSHGNLNWRNVVLDDGLEAKVTDYGLWKLGGGAGGSATAAAAAADVGRFGEMVITLVGGQQASAEGCESAYREWVEGHVESMVDSSMGGKVDLQEAERVLRVAFWCVQEDERLRPCMGEVAKVLEGALPVDPPPPPSPCLKQLGGSAASALQ